VDVVTSKDKAVSIKDKIAAAKAIFEAIGTRQEVSVTKKTEIGENLKELFQEIARGEDVVPVDAELVKRVEVPSTPLEVVEAKMKELELAEDEEEDDTITPEDYAEDLNS